MNGLNFMAHWRYQVYRHGWPAVLGLALMAGAIATQLLGVNQIHEQTAVLRADAAKLRQVSKQRPKQDEVAVKRLADFYASLPAASAALDAVGAIHLSATKMGVRLAVGDYRQVREGSSALLRYQVTLPARSSYPNMRLWLDDVMNTLPTAALDEISVRRDDVGSDIVEARLRLTLFMRAP
jgi:hypothetical protein